MPKNVGTMGPHTPFGATRSRVSRDGATAAATRGVAGRRQRRALGLTPLGVRPMARFAEPGG